MPPFKKDSSIIFKDIEIKIKNFEKSKNTLAKPKDKFRQEYIDELGKQGTGIFRRIRKTRHRLKLFSCNN